MESTSYRAIAIVGAGAILPDAPNVPAFWENIKRGRYSISEVYPERWDPALYYDADPAAPDKTYSKIGGWVRDYVWDPMKWRSGRPAARRRCHGWRPKMGHRLHAGSAGRLWLSQAPAGSESHGCDPRKRHGRGETLPHCATHLFSGICARTGGQRRVSQRYRKRCVATLPASCMTA